SQANLAVFLAFLKPGDTVLSMDLGAGGHLSHGAGPNISGKWMNVVSYGVDDQGFLDYAQLREMAIEHQPKLIIAGGSAYPRGIDFDVFRLVADEVGAILLVDMAHWAGLVAAGVHPNPVPVADVVTTTTYKNLRGVRGGIIVSKRSDIARRLNSAVFPGVQGSVILNAVAAKAVCLHEAMQPDFAVYGGAVLDNARSLATSLIDGGVDVLTGGTDTPLVVIDLRAIGITGAAASDALEVAGLTANKNGVPNDPQPPQVTSGIRFGTSAGTARGLDTSEFSAVGGYITDILHALARGDQIELARVQGFVRQAVSTITQAHPIYPR
ncbi:MAG: aminotransferase class I/II-fold pyridoxal phosphate-dependent enzyme, partial [Actinobacteria bacterium]|nr:aminotransferase class I/II-fold pyridoxal phosphate-dependent enzyme [Actinomycetota bacterium]